MVRLAVYGGISTFLTLSIIAAAFRQRANFYAACIYLSKSSACIMILMNMGFFLTVVLGKILQTIFFGRLRAVEIEHLYERAWYAFTETCLAMTIFRDEFNTGFVVTFTILLFLKIFHWLCQDRVEFMEQSPAVPLSFHIRMISLMEILGIVDLILASYAINIAMHKEPNMMIMFAFEYSILTATILSTIIKYILNVIDMRREEQWENKSIYVFYLELVTDFFKLIVYLIFFAIILVFYGIALHIIRDLYVTLRSFLQKCGDLVRYRRATRNMNERYPSATNEELERLSDRTCIICREEMMAAAAANNNANDNNAEPQQRDRRQESNNNMGDVPKKLPCGHIFHFHCLRSWLERQQSCPTCRRPVLEQQTPAVQLQQQQRPIQAQAARNGLQGQPQQHQLPPGMPFPNNPGFIANAFPGIPTIMWQHPAMHGQFNGQLPVAPMPLANLPNIGEQDNGVNQNVQQPQPLQPNNSQDTRQDLSQNSQSTDTEVRTATETNGESSTTSNAQNQNSSSSTRRPNQPVTPRMPWDQLSSSASRTFNNAQPSMSFQPTNLSQFPMQAPPGLIPLFPVLPLRNDGTINNNSNTPSSTLEPLTEEQIRLLETNTRAAYEEKIRVLQEAQVQIYNVISVLTQAVSAFPNVPITTSSTEENSSINNNNNNDNESNIGNVDFTTNTNDTSQNEEVKGNKGKGKSVTVTDEEELYN